MKRERHGRASILTPDEIELLFNQGLKNLRDQALFGFCLYTACRINEACTQLSSDAYDSSGKVRPYMTIRKGNSKGKLASRTIPTSEDLRLPLGQYRPQSGDQYLFPGRWNKKHLHPDSASLILRTAVKGAIASLSCLSYIGKRRLVIHHQINIITLHQYLNHICKV